MIKSKLRHGKSGTSEYKIWRAMKERCLLPNNISYGNYGGRGISVCDKWVNSFNDFYADMGDRPSNKHSIDRIENDGNYEPDNCKWSTRSEQTINQRMRSDNTSGVRGVYKMKNGNYIARITIKGKCVNLGTYFSIDEAAIKRHAAERKYFNSKEG